VGRMLRLGKQMEVKAKGIERPVTLSEVLGIGGRHKLSLPQSAEPLVPLNEEIPFRYAILEDALLSGETFKGSLTKLGAHEAEARLENPVRIFCNLKLHLIGSDRQEVPGALYCKVVGAVSGDSKRFSIHFTSKSPEIEAFLRGCLPECCSETLPTLSSNPTASGPRINAGPGSDSQEMSRRKTKPRGGARAAASMRD